MEIFLTYKFIKKENLILLKKILYNVKEAQILEIEFVEDISNDDIKSIKLELKNSNEISI